MRIMADANDSVSKPDISNEKLLQMFSSFLGVVAGSSDAKAHQSAAQKALAELRNLRRVKDGTR